MKGLESLGQWVNFLTFNKYQFTQLRLNMNALILFSLLLVSSCSSSSFILDIFGKQTDVTVHENKEQLIIKGKTLPAIKLSSATEAGLSDTYVWESRRESLWKVPGFNGNKHAFSLIVTKPQSTMGQMLLRNHEHKQWIHRASCLDSPETAFIIQIILNDFTQIGLGCLIQD